MEFIADLFIFAAEEDLAEGVAIGRKDAAGMFGEREERWARQFMSGGLVVFAAVEAPDPCFSTTVDLALIGANDHFAGGVECADAGECLFCLRSLVGDELD